MFAIFINIKLAPHGFEPWSQGPGPCMIGHYTTGLQKAGKGLFLKSFPKLLNMLYPFYSL